MFYPARSKVDLTPRVFYPARSKVDLTPRVFYPARSKVDLNPRVCATARSKVDLTPRVFYPARSKVDLNPRVCATARSSSTNQDSVRSSTGRPPTSVSHSNTWLTPAIHRRAFPPNNAVQQVMSNLRHSQQAHQQCEGQRPQGYTW